MTVDLAALREHVGPGPSDDVLEDLLAAALEAIDLAYGVTSDAKREYLRPFGQWVRLGRRASEVTTVLEGTDEVDSDHYELWDGGFYIRRLDDDGNPSTWSAMVDVSYVPLSEDNERDRVTIALVDLDLNRPAGLTSITVGPWSEQYSQGDEAYLNARRSILGSLRPARVGTW